MRSASDAAYEELVQAVVARLPEGITQREKALRMVLETMPSGHGWRGRIVQMLLHLEEHERIQMEFSKPKTTTEDKGTNGTITADHQRGQVDG